MMKALCFIWISIFLSFCTPDYDNPVEKFHPELVGTPGNVMAVGADGQITISWDGEGADGYKVYYDNRSGGPYYEGRDASEGPSPVDAGSVTTFTLTGLTNEMTYYIVITAYKDGVEGGYSGEVSATPKAPIEAPVAPTGLAPTAGDGRISLSWDAVEGAINYRVYYDSDKSGEPYDGKGAAEGPCPITVSTNSIDLTGLINGKKYYISVTAENAMGEGPFSKDVTAAPDGGEGPGLEEGYCLVTGGVVNFGGGSVSSDKSVRTSGKIFVPVTIQGNKYRVRMK